MLPALAIDSRAVTSYQMNTEAMVVVVAVVATVVDEVTEIAQQAGLGWLIGPGSVTELRWMTEALLALWNSAV